MKEFYSYSESDTEQIAAEIARQIKAGDVFALIGDLGAGKTAFVRGIVGGLNGDTTAVSSPTFAIVNEYDAKITIYHFDVYRIQNASPEEFDWIDDYLFGSGVCLIEWADNILDILPKNYIHVEIKKTGDNERKIRITRQS